MASAPPAYNASTITVEATLGLLDGPFAVMAKGISEDIYTFWLGSGISFDRVPGLKQVVKNVLKFLQIRVDNADQNCRFRNALNSIIILTNPSQEERARINFDQPIEDWPDIETIAHRLTNNYSRMLDIPVEGEEQDFLLWAGVDVPSTYANPTTAPDAEHLCLALLIVEGVASQIASANWDNLVEKAVTELGNGAAISVIVSPEDARGPQLRTRLYKFHGCAAKAAQEPNIYRNRLIGRQSQINRWRDAQENGSIIEQLVLWATTRRTLMIGLSAQDSNIQGVFTKAEATMHWPWPSDELAYVIASNQLGPDQQGLLQNVYRANYTPANRTAINQSSLIQAYGKPLLTSLVLHVLASKLGALATSAPGTLDSVGRERVVEGIKTLRNKISGVVEMVGHEAFMRELIAISERTHLLFRDGLAAATVSKTYLPLFNAPINIMMAEPTIPRSGLQQLGVALGLIGIGINDANWVVRPGNRMDIKSGAIRIETETQTVNLFFASNALAALNLYNNEHIDSDVDSLIVHSLERVPAMARSPRSAPGRTGRIKTREVSIKEIMTDSADSNLLFTRFRQEAAL